MRAGLSIGGADRHSCSDTAQRRCHCCWPRPPPLTFHSTCGRQRLSHGWGRAAGRWCATLKPSFAKLTGKAKQREIEREGLCAKFFRERPHLDPTSQLENYKWDWRTTKVNADGTQEGEIIREEWRCPHCNKMDMKTKQEWEKHGKGCEYRPRQRGVNSDVFRGTEVRVMVASSDFF
jgi:hypothetical protein